MECSFLANTKKKEDTEILITYIYIYMKQYLKIKKQVLIILSEKLLYV